MNKTHLINTRDTVIFDTIDKKVDDISIFNELYYYIEELQKQLKNIGIDYNDLKKCLIPANNGDIAFIFNWQNINNEAYGEYILSLLMPFLLKNNFCYIHGDYGFLTDSYNVQINKFNALNNALYKRINFISPSSCYVVYITNIGLKKALEIDSYLKRKEISYLGFANLNNNNLFKTILSVIITQAFIKINNNIIQPSADNLVCEKNNDFNFITLKRYFNQVINVPSYYHDIFLLYKIPSIIEPQYKDRELFLTFKYLNNSIENTFFKDFEIVIDDNKIDYIFTKKRYIADKWNIHNKEELKKFLILKIQQSLLSIEIFNLEIKKEYSTYQFDICIEHLKIKYIVGLKLLAKEKQIRFITISSIKIK